MVPFLYVNKSIHQLRNCLLLYLIPSFLFVSLSLFAYSDLIRRMNTPNFLEYIKPLHYVPTDFTDEETLKLYSWTLGYTVILFVKITVLSLLFHKQSYPSNVMILRKCGMERKDFFLSQKIHYITAVRMFQKPSLCAMHFKGATCSVLTTTLVILTLICFVAWGVKEHETEHSRAQDSVQIRKFPFQ